MTSVAVIKGCVKLPPKNPPKVTEELGIAIKGDGLGHSMQTHYLFEEQIGYLNGI